MVCLRGHCDRAEFVPGGERLVVPGRVGRLARKEAALPHSGPLDVILAQAIPIIGQLRQERLPLDSPLVERLGAFRFPHPDLGNRHEIVGVGMVGSTPQNDLQAGDALGVMTKPVIGIGQGMVHRDRIIDCLRARGWQPATSLLREDETTFYLPASRERLLSSSSFYEKYGH